jgi:hypothetical protein
LSCFFSANRTLIAKNTLTNAIRLACQSSAVIDINAGYPTLIMALL